MLFAKLFVAPPHRIYFRYAYGGDASIFANIILSVRVQHSLFLQVFCAVRIALISVTHRLELVRNAG